MMLYYILCVLNTGDNHRKISCTIHTRV